MSLLLRLLLAPLPPKNKIAPPPQSKKTMTRTGAAIKTPVGIDELPEAKADEL